MTKHAQQYHERKKNSEKKCVATFLFKIKMSESLKFPTRTATCLSFEPGKMLRFTPKQNNFHHNIIQ